MTSVTPLLLLFEQKLNSAISNNSIKENNRILLFSHDFISVQIDIRKKISDKTFLKSLCLQVHVYTRRQDSLG